MADGASEEAAVRDLASAVSEWINEARSLGREVPEPGSAEAAARSGLARIRRLIDKQMEFISTQGQNLDAHREALGAANDISEAVQELESSAFGFGADFKRVSLRAPQPTH